MKEPQKVFRNVTLGINSTYGDFVIIGNPPIEVQDGELPTSIGKHALIRSHTVIYAGNEIGDRLTTGHGVLIRENNKIGANVSIGSHTVVEHSVVIGNNVRIHSNCFIPEFTILEDDCWIGPAVVMTNSRYPQTSDAKNKLQGPIVKSGAIIGGGAILLPGVTIGSLALIGAGSVVVADVPESTVVVGNPAKKINSIQNIKDYT